jgi:hypothetical protein
LEEQQCRLLEQPETISHHDLQEMIADHSDRLDMGKTAKHLHGHVNLANNLLASADCSWPHRGILNPMTRKRSRPTIAATASCNICEQIF